MLKVNGLDVFYDGLQALDEVSFEVEEKELLALVGSNGAGKTTLLNSINGLIRPRSGSIEFLGSRIDGLAIHKVVARGITLIPESKWIFPTMSVMENLMMGAYQKNRRNGFQERMESLFQYFPILRERGKNLANTLSGGELQMLVIARGLMSEPKLLLLDEPSLGLAPRLVKQVFEVIGRLHREKGLSIILAEQNINLALELAQKGLVLENGRIVMCGRAAELIHDPGIREKYLGL
ncbi:MAG: ABC transporter ATP-binding protein [Thermodesulfobacteriota bacterium]